MNDFRLFAHGVEFDSAAYLTSSPLKFDGSWRRGEYGVDHPKSNGVFKLLGDGETTPLDDQDEIAIEYLRLNRDALKALAAYPRVTTFILGLAYHVELDPDTAGLCIGPSSLLMWHCLDIGVTLNFYITLNQKH